MNPVTIISVEIIKQWVGCCNFALGCTLYYKKSFLFRSETGAAAAYMLFNYMISLLHTYRYEYITYVLTSQAVILPIILLTFRLNPLSRTEWVKFLLVTFTFSQQFQEELCLPAAFIIAVTQLIRKPIKLKIALGELRIVCGPAFIISLYYIARHENFAAISTVRFIAAFIAGTILRPDNAETLVITPPTVRNYFIEFSQHRTYVHGAANALAASMLFPPYSVAFAAIMGLYLIGARLPLRIARAVAHAMCIMIEKIL